MTTANGFRYIIFLFCSPVGKNVPETPQMVLELAATWLDTASLIYGILIRKQKKWVPNSRYGLTVNCVILKIAQYTF